MELQQCSPEKSKRSASVPHIKFEVPRPPFPHFSLHTRVMLCSWNRSGKFALWFVFLVLGSILIPYSVYLANGHVRPLLQVLSHTDPNHQAYGIFSFALYIMAAVGLLMIIVRYVYVSSENERRNWKPDLLNRMGLAAGCVSFLGMILLASYPRGKDPSDNDHWDTASFFPHMIGAFLLFFFGAVYLSFQTALSLYFCEGGQKRTVVIRFILFLAAAICFATATLSSYSNNEMPNKNTRQWLPGIILKKKEPEQEESLENNEANRLARLGPIGPRAKADKGLLDNKTVMEENEHFVDRL